MRLTLRTLLAYLDNTLEPEDAETLRAKLAESGFATQLVQRIRATLVDGSLSAPSPTAVSPVSEANMISEYLDSTLSTEQVAEIERACLESAPHLAEAAACHQILTMVLGKPANVSDELRQRIYEFPDINIADIPSSGSFSSVAVPEPDTLTGMPDLPAATIQPGQTVQPVGIADSGVSDAPTRLRESGTIDDVDDALGTGKRVAAGDIYGGTIRPSRITPWLVSLALVGVFAFAFIKIFAPLFSNSVAQTSSQDQRDELYPELADLDPVGDIEVPAEQAPVMEAVGTPAVDVKSSEELPLPADPSVEVMPAPRSVEATPVEVMPAPKVVETPAAPPVPRDLVPRDLVPSDLLPMDPLTGEPIASPPVPSSPPASTDAASQPMPPKATDLPAATAVAAADKVSGADEEMPATTDAPPAAKDLAVPAAEPDAPLAKIGGEEILLFARAKNTDWAVVTKDSMVNQRPTLLNAPKFRSTLNIGDDASMELVGATQVSVMRPQDDQEIAGLDIGFGRVLISVNQPDVQTQINMAGRAVQLSMPGKDSVAAIEVRHLRRPGFDPFIPEHHIPIARVVCVAGKVDVSTGGASESLEAGQQWMIRGSDPGKVSKVLVATWFNPDQSDESPIDISAREGLRALLQGEQPLALSLREAIGFRKSEVVALAAQTMLHLGSGDVYFGTDGILSKQSQRLFWKDHVSALRTTVNRNVEAATAVRDDIAKMDSADGKSLFRLLQGYSQNQLAEGGDAELIKLLESSVMSVRVLAVENLREITGTTLNFRAEEENVARRSQSIKKWQVLLRKGDIRWTQE